MKNTPVIEVADLRVEYGTTAAVAGTSFEVAPGEVFALLGTNGAGKTTTLDVLEGYRSATAGSVRVFGMDPLKDRDTLAPRLGIMLQEAGFFETLTVRQTITAWRRFYRRPRSLAESVSMVGLDHRVDARVNALSGGERRRLDLALALLGHPDLLFLDEPTTGMDPEGRRQSLELVSRMVGHGMTVVLTTHYLEEAEQLADRVAIMHRGTIRRMGTMTELLAGAGDARITFEILTPAADSVLSVFGGSLGEHAAGTGRSAVEIRTAEQTRTLRDLLAWADRNHLEISNLEVRRSRLEDVFLGLADGEDTQQADDSVPQAQRELVGGGIRS